MQEVLNQLHGDIRVREVLMNTVLGKFAVMTQLPVTS